jgi:hypothetical protein
LDVRFVPIADIAPFIRHLVGAGKQRLRHGRATGCGANSLTAIQAVESGSRDTENRCAKLNHIRRGVVSVA